MKSIFRPARNRRGMALLIAISVLAMLVVLAVAAQSSLEFSHQQARGTNARLDRIEAAAAVLERLPRAAQLPAEVDLMTPGGIETTIRTRALEPGDELWLQTPGVVYREGDHLVTIAWPDGAPADSYIHNTYGQRTRPIALPAGQ